MALFDGYPTYDRYRTLKRTTPMMFGEDVYALQTALNDLGFDTGGTDGYFGDATQRAVKAAQSKFGLTVDGLAGGGTQAALTKNLTNQARSKYNLPAGLVYGQCSHESGCRLGNYSPKHSAHIAGGPYFDAGVAQFNIRFTPVKDAFTVPYAVNRLGKHLREYYDKFAGVSSVRRRWELAAGAWNAPAWACYLARQEGATGVRAGETARPTDAQRATLEQYMDSATAYMIL